MGDCVAVVIANLIQVRAVVVGECANWSCLAVTAVQYDLSSAQELLRLIERDLHLRASMATAGAATAAASNPASVSPTGSYADAGLAR